MGTISPHVFSNLNGYDSTKIKNQILKMISEPKKNMKEMETKEKKEPNFKRSLLKCLK